MASLKNIIGRNAVISLYYIFRIFPIKKKKIFVKNFYGKGFGDSSKYIVNYLLKNYQGFDVVWSVNDKHDFPKGIRSINMNGICGMIKTIYEQTTAKVWIDNSRKYQFERKRKGQYYIQTWHGDIGFKKLLGDLKDTFPKKEIDTAYYDSGMTDLFVCSNEWFRDHCKERMFYDGEIAMCGTPRRDLFYTDDNMLREQIRKEIGVPDKVKLLLYVPTFRKEEFVNHRLGGYANSFDWGLILEALKQRFGGEWCGLMRLHPHAAKYSKDLNLPTNVFNVTNYPDISELMYVSDACISDYSSALFDFAITKKPGFIFASDKNNYEDERGYLFPESVLPFTVSTDVNQLSENIKNFDAEEYAQKHHSFYGETIHVCENGNASEYLARRIADVCN